MYVCIDCGEIFETPEHYIETHGLERPPYEEWDGCPNCAGAFTKAHRCDYCGEWIDGDYIKIGNKRYCNGCAIHYELGDEW